MSSRRHSVPKLGKEVCPSAHYFLNLGKKCVLGHTILYCKKRDKLNHNDNNKKREILAPEVSGTIKWIGLLRFSCSTKKQILNEKLDDS